MEQQVEWFEASGRVGGAVTLALCAVAAVVCVVEGADAAAVAGIVLFAVLAHVSLLRPRIGTSHDDLIYRRMFSDLTVPLAAISEMRVGRLFEVTVGDRRLVSPAVGRSLRRTVRRPPRNPAKIYADLVEDQTHARMDAARERAGVTIGSPAQRELAAGVRRTWAWPEIVVALVVLVVFVVTLFH
jgi:hypothetical protein